eukprot:CAMPEP_0183825212 /NCGR_PEP_ID=MMETSP0807_2-20130328/1007_1 /TAXON_ID=88271 /ORGANISM="Picocystis salinarum, Strain CCMP1897" /LENGTH=117 /DNA_ID=CAMNT_0026070183 /DNA_START=313 /DNA_END=666 /DNA_ORIENTATION=-
MTCPGARALSRTSASPRPEVSIRRVRRRTEGAAGASPNLPGPLEEDPILRKAVKDPVAFFGGVCAGVLQLEVGENPLREWVQRTAKEANVDLQSLKVEVETRHKEGREGTNGTKKQG